MLLMAKPTGTEAFGSLLKRWRLARNLTGEEAAEYFGIASKGTWSSLENGMRRPSYATLFKLSAKIGMSMPDLARLAGYPVPDEPADPDALARDIARLMDTAPEYRALLERIKRLPPDRARLALAALDLIDPPGRG